MMNSAVYHDYKRFNLAELTSGNGFTIDIRLQCISFSVLISLKRWYQENAIHAPKDWFFARDKYYFQTTNAINGTFVAYLICLVYALEILNYAKIHSLPQLFTEFCINIVIMGWCNWRLLSFEKNFRRTQTTSCFYFFYI